MRPTRRVRPSGKCVLSLAVLFTAMTGSAFAQMTHVPMVDTSGAAKLVAFTGQLSVIRHGGPWALHVNDYVQPNEVIVTGSDGSGMFKVADGSTFEIFPNSKVVFRANSWNWDDLLEIVLGKIKVQIEHPGGVPNRNKVRTPTAVISVRGTTFDVEYDPDKEYTTVLDEEGSVDVARALRPDDHKILNANDSIVVYKNEPLAHSPIDKGGFLKKAIQMAMDALTQQEINSRTSGPSTPTTTPSPVPSTPAPTGSGNKDNSPPPPPPPPPAP